MLPQVPSREWHLYLAEELRELRYALYQWESEEGPWAQRGERLVVLATITQIVAEEALRAAQTQLSF
jgi:hypothetical protein